MSAREWNEVRLGDLIEIKHGYAFDGKAFSEERLGRPIIVNIGNFDYSGGFRFDSTRVRECVGDYPKEYVLNPGDILLAMTCQTAGGEILGVPATVPNDENIYLHNQRLGKIIINKPSEISPDFIYYLCLTSDFRHELFVTATGTKILHTAPKRIENYKFMLPSKDEQVKIAKVLSDIDKRIDVNNRINKNLEEMSQAIFKRWFIDFEFPNENGEPYKSSGGEMVESEMGLAPKGWSISSIKDISKEVICGKTPSTSVKENYGDFMPFITIPDMHNNVFITETERKLSQNGVKTQPKKVIPANSICVSCIASPGLVTLTSEDSTTNQQINSIVCKDGISYYYIYMTLNSLSEQIRILGSGGSATLNLNKTEFEKIRIILPNLNCMKLYDDKVRNIFFKILNNQRENISLRKLRDTLLPKLMSGEIQVP